VGEAFDLPPLIPPGYRQPGRDGKIEGRALCTWHFAWHVCALRLQDGVLVVSLPAVRVGPSLAVGPCEPFIMMRYCLGQQCPTNIFLPLFRMVRYGVYECRRLPLFRTSCVVLPSLSLDEWWVVEGGGNALHLLHTWYK
jgi:hypothetical protein